MIVSVICALVSILFLVTLYALFNSKLKVNNAKSKLYKIMIFILFILALLVISAEVLLKNMDNESLADFFMRMHWRGVFVIIFVLYYYVVNFVGDFKYDKITDIFKNIKYVKITTIICFALFAISFFLPIELKTNDTYNYIPGVFGLYLQGYMISVLFMILIYYKWFNENTENKLDRTIVVGISLIFSIFLILQFSVREVSFYGIAFTTVLFFFYSTSENPDLEMIANLKKLNQEIIDSSNAKTDIILNMSHDIRSPMNAIINYSAELVEVKDLNNEVIINNIDNILVASKNLLNILDDILEMSGREEHYGENIYNLRDVVSELENITLSRIGNKPIKLILNVDDSVPKLLLGNSAKMYRILMNILSNSAKYTEVGKIILDVKGQKIDEGNVLLKVSVSDTGFGIKDEDKPKVFSEYARLKDATNQKIEGTGLGIVNTKKNVEVLGGKIWFESIYGAGTTFFMDIPQKICNTKTLEEYKNENEVRNNALLDCSNLTALVVDDNKVNINVTIRLLKKYNFKIDYVTNGNDCISRIKDGNKYDIIFLDLMMGDIDGEEVLSVLKYLNKQYDIPVVVALTANVLNGVRDVYLKKGFDEYLAKPIDMKELNRVINLFFRK